MSTRVQSHITGRLSLRAPQAESLARLKQALDAAPEMLGHERDVAAILSTLKAQFPTLEDFEREFPSLCFALATGVGKTRLMGAFIAYLHLAHGINNFFVLAPNLTIYNKLITDFTRNTPKYVFKGIAEFAQQPPLIITGDNYDQTGAAVDDQSMGFRPRRARQHLQHLQDQLRSARRQGAAHQADEGGAGRQLLQPPGEPARPGAVDGRIAPLPGRVPGCGPSTS
jgi:hypothetical protein